MDLCQRPRHRAADGGPGGHAQRRGGNGPEGGCVRSTKVHHTLFKLLGLMVILFSFAGGWLAMDYREFKASPLPIPAEGYRHIIPPGTSVTRLAADLQQAGIMPHPFYLRWMARWQGQAGQIKAGEYQFGPGITPGQLLEQVVSGAVFRHTLTIVEGWSFAQLLGALRRHEAIAQTLGTSAPDEVMKQLGHPGQHAEGRFLPDTYHFPRGLTDVAFLERAYQMLETRLAQEWEQRDPDLPLKSPYETLILASIIEKETGVPDERPQIAGVFMRRLQQGMRLQTDPTVIYALGAAYDGTLRRNDLLTDSPYNTYLYTGLPPTPIALPGGASIHAALHPAPGDTLYFVSRGDGSHVFSATLDQHNEAVRRYQLLPAQKAINGSK